jgi:rhamnogalacturonyl hydrolase YesR
MIGIIILMGSFAIPHSSFAYQLRRCIQKNSEKTFAVDKDSLLILMEHVADWQIANQHKSKVHDLKWNNAVFYIGLMELSKISNDTCYREWLMRMGRTYNWQPHSRMYMADDLAVSQMYLEMYRTEGDKRMLVPTYARTEWVVNHPSTSGFLYDPGDEKQTERWSWCDALFMAPPVYAQMYNITGDTKFMEFMEREYQLTYDYLYDKNEQLFYRDHRFFERREENGTKVFWGRGNGWVLSGLVRILKEIPETNQNRFFFQKLFVEMCDRISALQDENGYWHSSLLDMQNFPDPETSCSGLFIYAFSYGVNSGLLDLEKYLPIIGKGWKALESAVFPDGKLGWVQPVGGWPVKVEKEMTEAYGVGAFLLAGSEVYRLLPDYK